MYIFYDIILITFFSFFFLIFYFLYEKFITIKSLSFLRINLYIMEAFNGFVLGAIAILLEVILKYFDFNFKIPMFFIIGLILLLKKNEKVAIAASSISLIYYLFTNNINEMTWYLFSTFFAIYFIYITILHFLNEEIAIKSVFISTFVFLILGLILSGFIFEKIFNRKTMETTIILYLSLIIFYVFLDFGIKLSISSNILFETTNYVYSKYIRYSLYEKVIGEYITKNKTKYGIYGLFEYRITNNIEPKNNEIRDSILSIFENNVDSNAILFSYRKNIFGFFIPKNNLKDIDEFKTINEVKKYLFKINSTFQSINNIKFNVEAFSALSFYGKNENTINQLEKNCIFQIKNMITNPNNVSVFKYQKYQQKLKNSLLIEFMDQKIDLNLFLNKNLKLYDIKTNKHISNFIYTDYNEEYDVLSSFENMLKVNKWKNIFNRFFAYQAINKYNFNDKINYIEYSPFVIDTNFKLKDFENTLKNKKINKDNIVWYFSFEDLINNYKFKFIENVISKRFKIALTNFEKAKISEINKLKPYALISKNFKKIPSKFKNFKVIFTNINNYSNYENLDKNLNYEIGGMFFDNEDNFVKLIKQSKIYIEKEGGF